MGRKPPVAQRARGSARERRESTVDDAVEMTFPASDPAVPGHATGTEPAARPPDRRAPVITKEEIERAAGKRR
jgi:hypothetical protein